MIESLDEALQMLDDSALTLDGFEDCIIGVAGRCGAQPLLVYDFDLILDKLVADGLSYEEALEFYSFNIAGAWMGEGTPLLMEQIQK